MYHKRREECVLFLEEVFGTTVHPEALRSANFKVECFANWFEKDGKPIKNVKDPQIIKFCSRHKWVLITTDKQMRFTHVETIKQSDIAIVATESNRGSMMEWVQALMRAKLALQRHVKKTPRPWFAHLSKTGRMSVETITSDCYTRRRRPVEGQEKQIAV